MKPENLLKAHAEKCRIAKEKIHRGTWTLEPEVHQFMEDYVPCFMIRDPDQLYWKCFVAIDKKHPWYLKIGNEWTERRFDYVGFMNKTITTDYDNDTDPLWCYGIKLNDETKGDLTPSQDWLHNHSNFKKKDQTTGLIYRDQGYAIEVCRRLAMFLADIEMTAVKEAFK